MSLREAMAAMLARDPLYLPACPVCSSLRANYGRGEFRAPRFWFGNNSQGYTLAAECVRGCAVWGEGPGEWEWVYGRAVELTEVCEPALAMHSECKARLAAWWRGRVRAFDFAGWSVERIAMWKASEGGVWLTAVETSNAQHPTSNAQ